MHDAADKFPNLFQILSAVAAHADAEEFDQDEIVRSSFSPSAHVTRLTEEGLRELETLRRQPRVAAQIISKLANRNFSGADDPVAWLSALLQKLPRERK